MNHRLKARILLLLAASILSASLIACQPAPPASGDGSTEEIMIPQVADTSPETPNNTDETQPSPESPGVPMESIQTYKNPILTSSDENAWPGYGFGDPFVMRYNGTYYLYSSTKDGSNGVRCWSSLNLRDWQFEGYCTTDPRTKGAYAPEVYYYNGYFYMYTSPAGNGHYVLRSTSPTKGFTVVTDNLGMSIDGSVFVDNDGKWYFYTAGGGSMMAYEMESPTAMKNGRPLGTVSVNGGWTEGPMVVFHDGYYYMTYTGNHVLSPSYRILYASSASSPLEFDRHSEPPLLVNTTDEVLGIGHSSTVKGPDLDGYYIVYHSLVNKVPNRNMNIDRLVFDGDRMAVMGPTVSEVQAPDMPDVYHHFAPGSSLKGWVLTGELTAGSGLSLTAGSRILSKTPFTGDFTAEYNVLNIEECGRAGALFAYTDEESFGSCVFDPAAQKVLISITVGGKTEVIEVDTVRSFGEDTRFDCLQSLQIERSGRDYTFYMNDRLLYVLKDCDLAGGAIGYTTEGGEASFGFIGGTAAVGGRGIADDYKPVSDLSGLIPAVSCTEAGADPSLVSRVMCYAAVTAAEGRTLTYRVLADESGRFDLSVLYAAKAHTQIEIAVDGTAAGSLALPKSGQLTTAVYRGIPLSAGQHEVTLTVRSGGASLSELTLLRGETVTEQTVSLNDPIYTDGPWQELGDALGTRSNSSTAKRIYGHRNWGDYAVEATVTLRGGSNGGLLVRITDPGAPTFLNDTPTQEDARGGTDWVQGYYIGLTDDTVVLGKQAYSWQHLETANVKVGYGTSHTLRVECAGATIRVYLDGTFCLEYTDPRPFIQGGVGVRAFDCGMEFEDLRVSPLSE